MESLANSHRLPGWFRRYGWAALLVFVFGFVRYAAESRLAAERATAGIGNVRLNLNLRERITQNEFLAALSGFRALVADVLFVQAHVAWGRVEYGAMNLLFSTATTLVPHNIQFWDIASWHMAYNASVAVMENPAEPRQSVRLREQHEYFLLGKSYVERGIANNPDSYALYHSLGAIERDKLGDFCAASAAFDRAAACTHAPGYEKRFAAYALVRCPGHEREAYERLRALYELGPQERLPSVERDLRALEEKLEIPPEQRIYKPR